MEFYLSVLLPLSCFFFYRFWKFSIALLCIVLEECRGTALGKKSACAGVFFHTDVMRRRRILLSSLEHKHVSAVREIFASSGCKAPARWDLLASKCTAGNVALNYYTSILFILHKCRNFFSVAHFGAAIVVFSARFSAEFYCFNLTFVASPPFVRFLTFLYWVLSLSYFSHFVVSYFSYFAVIFFSS